jgi:hypothetical protein
MAAAAFCAASRSKYLKCVEVFYYIKCFFSVLKYNYNSENNESVTYDDCDCCGLRGLRGDIDVIENLVRSRLRGLRGRRQDDKNDKCEVRCADKNNNAKAGKLSLLYNFSDHFGNVFGSIRAILAKLETFENFENLELFKNLEPFKISLFC